MDIWVCMKMGYPKIQWLTDISLNIIALLGCTPFLAEPIWISEVFNQYCVRLNCASSKAVCPVELVCFIAVSF